MEIFYGTREVGKDVLERRVQEGETALRSIGAGKNEIVVCRARTQLGTVLQWQLARRMKFVPMFTAPDFNLEESYAHKRYTIDAVLDESPDGGWEAKRFNTDRIRKTPDLPQGGIIQMTSATTGEAKMVLRTFDDMEVETRRYQAHMGFLPEDRFMTMAPFYHSYAFFCVYLMCEKTGASLVLPDMILPRRLIELTGKMQVNCIYAIPYILQKMTEVTTFDSLGSKMKVVMSTAQSVSPELSERFYEKFGCGIHSQYGSTEVGCVAMAPASCGGVLKPLPGVRFETVKNESAQNQLKIHIDGSSGYYILKEGIQKIGDGGYLTNDIAEITEEGGIRILGRADRVIIRTGEKLDADYVEKILEGFPNIEKASIHLNDKNELVCEYATSRKNEEVDVAEWKRFCAIRLLSYQIPERFLHNPNIASSGKSWKELS